MTLQQIFLILKARIGVVILVGAIVVASTLAVTFLLPREYEAETSIIVDVKSADPILGGFIPSQMAPGYLATQVDIIRSDRVARRVVELTGMHELPVVQEQWLAATQGEGAIETWLAGALKSKLSVRPSRDSSVITISYSGRDPEFVATIANAFADAYIDTTLELKVKPARQYATWFDERTGGLRDKLEQAQQRLSEFEREHGIIATDGRLDVETARLVELSSQLVTVQGLGADSRSRQSQIEAVEFLPEVVQSPLIGNMKADIARKEGERGQLAGRVGPNHPELARADSELASLRARLASEIRRIAGSLDTTSLVSSAREAEIAEAVAVQRERVLELKSHRDRLAVLQRDVESAQRSYDLVAERLAHVSLESQTQQTNVAVLTPASAPLHPAGPRKLIILAIGAIVGGLLGLASALLLEFGRPRLRSSADLVSLAGIPMLGALPDYRRRSSERRVLLTTAV